MTVWVQHPYIPTISCPYLSKRRWHSNQSLFIHHLCWFNPALLWWLPLNNKPVHAAMLKPVQWTSPCSHQWSSMPRAKKMKDQSVGLILSSFLEGKHMLTQTINHIWVRVLGHPPNSSSDPKEWEAARNLLQATNTTEIHWNTFSIILLKTFSIIYILRLSKIHTCHHLFYLSIGSAFHPAVRCKESLSEG